MKYRIENPLLNSYAQLGTTNMAVSFGMQLSCLWFSDFHAIPDLENYDALSASLLDTKDSLTLIDSNVDAEGGHVHLLEQSAKQDPTIYCKHVEYANLKQYLKDAPPWIQRPDAERYAREHPLSYERDLLGKRSCAKNALFPSRIVKPCLDSYKIPLEDIPSLIGDRQYKIGAGLDRSKKLMGGDNTVWTVVLKTINPAKQDDEYYILKQDVVSPNTGKQIKKTILQDHETYNLDSVLLESYETNDLLPYLQSQGIAVSSINPTPANQNIAFQELHRIFNEGRIHIPRDAKGLLDELSTFGYTENLKSKQGTYSFGHISRKFHDDRVYSLNWAVYSTARFLLKPYSIDNVICTSRSRHKKLCFLMGGEMILPCCEKCVSYLNVQDLFRDYQRLRLEDDLSIQDFFYNIVKINGSRIYQNI